MPIYMKYEGVEGDVTAKGYTGWIEVHSFQWGCSRHLETTTGAAGRRAAGAATVGEVVISKEHDNASGKVFNFAVLGGEGKKVKIDFLHEDNSIYCQYELEE